MSGNTPQPAGTLPERVVDYIGYSSAAMEKMAAELNALAGSQSQRQALIPQVADALVSGERIRVDEREKVAKILEDPVQTLELLRKVATHRNTSEQSLGVPVDATTKTAAVNSLSSPHVGQRNDQIKESDVRLWQGLGLPAPNGA